MLLVAAPGSLGLRPRGGAGAVRPQGRALVLATERKTKVVSPRPFPSFHSDVL